MKDKKIFDILAEEIIAKKQLENIDKEFVLLEIDKFLKKNPFIKNKLQQIDLKENKHITKNKFFRQALKGIRNDLNKLYGTFFSKKSIDKKYIYLDELKILMTLPKFNTKIFNEVNKKILMCHKSSKERLEAYPNLYSKLFSIIGKPKSIMDLACGLNPCSLCFMKLKNFYYYATELNRSDCEFLEEYFSIVKDYFKLTYTVERINLLEIKNKNIFKNLQEFDTCLLLKTVDTLERGKGHKITELLVDSIPAKWIIISFSTTTLKNMRMRYPKRSWIERMLNRKKLYYVKFSIPEEIFYVIKKM